MAVAAPDRVLSERSAVDLARAIRERELTAREVVEEHIAVCSELRAARLRAAAALEQAGAKVEAVSLRSMRRALELYPAVPKLESGVSVAQLLVAEGSAAVTLRSGLRRGGPHTRAAAAA